MVAQKILHSCLKKKLNAETDIINLKNVKKPNISDYDTVILGASIYMGKSREQIRDHE